MLGSEEIPSIEALDQALLHLAKLGYRPGAICNDKRVRPLLSLRIFGGPEIPERPVAKRELVEKVRSLLRELASELETLSDDDLAELPPLADEFDEPIGPAEHLKEATEIYFELGLSRPVLPSASGTLGRRRADSSALWNKKPRWFERSREPFVRSKLAEWIQIRELLCRGRAGNGARRRRVSSSNPLPNRGHPHGRGIRHSDFPDGFSVEATFRPSFNSYLDSPGGQPHDERSFAGARVIAPRGHPRRGFDSIHALEVVPGDVIRFSIYIHNNAGLRGNEAGHGPGVAHNVRVYVNYPTGLAAQLHHVSSYIRADNAVVDIEHQDLRTVSDNTAIVSERPISLRYVEDSAECRLYRPSRAAQSPPVDPEITMFKRWTLSSHHQYWLFTGDRSELHGNTEQDAGLGLPLGHDGSLDPELALGRNQEERLSWFGGLEHQGRVQFSMSVDPA